MLCLALQNVMVFDDLFLGLTVYLYIDFYLLTCYY
jgi:hypothetical protein